MQHYRREIRADQNKKARSSQRRDSTLHKLTSCSLLKTPPSHNVVTSTATLLVGTTSYGRNHRSHQQTEEPSNKKTTKPHLSHIHAHSSPIYTKTGTTASNLLPHNLTPLPKIQRRPHHRPNQSTTGLHLQKLHYSPMAKQ